MAKRIVLTGGGTGGHLIPLVQVAKKIKERKGNVDFMFMGPLSDMEKDIIGSTGIEQKKIISGKLYRYFTFRYLLDIFKFPIGVFQSLWHLLWYMPDAVFAKGGFASVPVVIAAKLYAIPILIHESDARPGLANRVSGALSSKIAITFERARIHFPPSKTVITGNPINPDVVGGNVEEARRVLDIHKEVKPVLLVLGGSQGAKVINSRILTMLKDLLKEYQIVHQTGKKNYDDCVAEAERQGYKTEHSDYFPFAFAKEEFKHYFALASVVISRAGSTAIAEIAANKKPSILIPIAKSANDHQRINAFEVSRADGTIVLEENNLRRNLLLHELKEIREKEGIRNKLIENIGRFYHPKAADKIANEVLKLAK